MTDWEKEARIGIDFAKDALARRATEEADRHALFSIALTNIAILEELRNIQTAIEDQKGEGT